MISSERMHWDHDLERNHKQEPVIGIKFKTTRDRCINDLLAHRLTVNSALENIYELQGKKWQPNADGVVGDGQEEEKKGDDQQQIQDVNTVQGWMAYVSFTQIYPKF